MPQGNFQEVISLYGIAGKNLDPDIKEVYDEARKILNDGLIPKKKGISWYYL